MVRDLVIRELTRLAGRLVGRVRMRAAVRGVGSLDPRRADAIAEFRRLRKRMVPVARRNGLKTDDDVFKMFS